MNNTVWQEFLGRLYNGFHNTTEVMALVGYRNSPSIDTSDVVEYVEYYTSNEESTVAGNFRNIVKDMAKYVLLRGEDSRFVLVHNHPMGTPEPSDSDRLMSERMLVACRLLGSVSMGSYIYIDGEDAILVGGREEEFTTQQIRISNQFNSTNVSMERVASQNVFLRVNELLENKDYRGDQLSEDAVDRVLGGVLVEPFGLVELDTNNAILAVYELDKLQPYIENRVTRLDTIYQRGMATVFMRDASRLALYDKRDNIERDERGLAEDTKKFIHAMRVSGYPINFYIN